MTAPVRGQGGRFVSRDPTAELRDGEDPRSGPRPRSAELETAAYDRPRPRGHDDRWRDHAGCAGLDPNIFVPTRGDTGMAGEPARNVCRPCPVRTDCLLASLDEPEGAGIWGGGGEPVRRRLHHLERTHGGYLDDCSCAFCAAVSAHFARLDGEETAPAVSYTPGARCGTSAKYGRGCRCDECRAAKSEQMRVREQARAARRLATEMADPASTVAAVLELARAAGPAGVNFAGLRSRLSMASVSIRSACQRLTRDGLITQAGTADAAQWTLAASDEAVAS